MKTFQHISHVSLPLFLFVFQDEISKFLSIFVIEHYSKTLHSLGHLPLDHSI